MLNHKDPFPAADLADLSDPVLDFIRQGQRAQAAVDAILSVEPERRTRKRKVRA